MAEIARQITLAARLAAPPEVIADYLRHIGKRGGQSKSAKKAESSRKNLEKGRAARKPKTEER